MYMCIFNKVPTADKIIYYLRNKEFVEDLSPI